MQPARRLAPWMIVLALALGLRLAAAAWWQERLPPASKFGWADSHSYWQLAGRIARGEPYEYPDGDARIFRTPGYPLFLSGLFVARGGEPPVWWARVAGCLAGTLAVAAVGGLARLLFDGRVAIVAAGLAAVYPGAIAMSIFILSESLFCPLMVFGMCGWVLASQSATDRGRVLYGLAAGALGGVATLVRPSWILFAPLGVAAALVWGGNRRHELFVGACVLAGTVAVMSPWWVRNYTITGRFVPTTLQVGASLYDGLNPQATGASNMDFVGGFYRRQKALDAAATDPLESVFEYRLDGLMRRESIGWAAAHPGEVARLAGIKFLRMWNPWPNAGEFRSWPLRIVVMTGYLPLVVLGLAGLWRYRKRGWHVVFLALPAVYFTALHVVFVSSIRYRQPAMLVLMVAAAAVVAGCYGPQPGKGIPADARSR